MANNNFIKHYLLSDEEVANLNRKFGQFIMTKSGSMYIDTDDERIQLGGGGGSSPGNSYTKAEVNALIAELENEISAAISGLEWKPAVETFADIATIYPTPADGWTVNVKDTDETYRYTGTEWILTSANSIPIATIDLDGLLSKEDKARIDSISTEVLSKISESEDGTLLFNGEEIKGGGGGITIDTELSEESENPVQNKIITSELNKKIAILEMPTGQNLDLLLADNYTVYHANDGHASMGLPDDVSGSYDLIVSGSTRANKYYQQLFNNDKIYFRSAKLSGIDIDVYYIYQYQLPNSHNGYSGNNLYIQCNGIEYGKLTGDEKCFVLIEEATNTINVYNTKQGRTVSVNYVNGAYSSWGMQDGTVTYSLTSFDLGTPTHTYENVQGLYSDVIPFFLDTQTEDILNFLNTGDKSAALNYQETVLSWSSWELLNNSITIDSELNSESTNPVQNKVISAKLDEVFQSVSNGKSKVAAAITDKGVNTAADATFDIMAENILAISSGGGNISFDISYTITSEAAFQNTIIYVGALCYPNKGRDIKVYVNNNYLGLYTFSGADEAPEMLSLMFMFDLQAGDNIIRLVCDTKDIVLLTMEKQSVTTFPTLTSDITTIDGYTYKTTASTCIDGSRLPYMPFNGTDALGGYDCWHPDFGEPQWLMIELPYQACIRSFTMQNRADYMECPKDVIFQGSNDSVNWVDITSFEFSYTGFEGITKTIKTDNTNFYKYYRWYIETVNADHGVIAKIKDMDMIGLPEKYILQYIV